MSETGLDVQQGYELQNSMIPGCKIVLIYVLWWWQCSKHDWNSAELQHFSKMYCERKYVQRYLVPLSSYTWLVHFLVIHRLAPLLIHGASLPFFPFIFVFLLCLESQINSWLFSTHHILKKTSKRYFKLTKYGWHWCKKYDLWVWMFPVSGLCLVLCKFMHFLFSPYSCSFSWRLT